MSNTELMPYTAEQQLPVPTTLGQQRHANLEGNVVSAYPTPELSPRPEMPLSLPAVLPDLPPPLEAVMPEPHRYDIGSKVARFALDTIFPDLSIIRGVMEHFSNKPVSHN